MSLRLRGVVGLAAVAVVAFAGLSTAAATRPDPDTWRLVWSDEFDGEPGSSPDASHWWFERGGGPNGWGNNEAQTYTADPANASLDGQGKLRITPTRDAAGSWSSARIQTVRADFAPPPGGRVKIEARIELPAGGQGYWPAFWMLGEPFRSNSGSWPASGEIDVMENVNNSATVHGTLHCGYFPGGPCSEKSGRSHSHALPTPAGQAGAHTYGVLWETAPARLSWQIDGHTYGTLTPADLGRETWDATFGHGYFVLLNVAVGGDLTGPPNAATVPGQSMVVDYVRVHTSF